MIAKSENWSLRADARSWVGAALLGAALLASAWALLHVGFWSRHQIVDTPVYQRYGDAILDGQVPYRDFDVEYPPAALPVFVLPSLASSDDYRGVFEGLMLACGIALIVLLAYALAAVEASTARLYGAVAFAALTPLALGSVVLTRYDLWPAALTVAALAGLASGRERLGFVALGLAVAAKIYPLVLLPLALLYAGRRRGWREAWLGLAVFAAVLLVVFLPFAILAPDGLWTSVERQGGRPLQIESLGAAVLLAGHQLELYTPTVVSTFGSQNLAGSLPDLLAAVLTGLQAVAVAAIWAVFARSRARPDELFAASAAAVAAFVALGKVVSPQFLVWLVPLVPLVTGPAGLAAGGVFAAALALTQLWFPTRYWDVVDLESAGWLVLVRDVALVALAAVLVAATRRPRERPRSA